MSLRTRISTVVGRARRTARTELGRTMPRLGKRLERLGEELQSRFAPVEHPGAETEFADLSLEIDENDFDFSPRPAATENLAADYGVLPEIELPSGSLSEKLLVFAESVRGATGSYAVFIADSQGLPLVSRHSMDDHVAISAALDQALVPIRASLQGDAQGSASLELDADNVLQVIWVNTQAGRYALGLIVPQSLGGEVVDALRAQLAPIFLQQGNAA